MNKVVVSRTDTRRIERCRALAERGTGEFRLGALLTRGGATLAVGWNKHRNDPQTIDRGFSVHAEDDCLRKVDLNSARRGTLYVARITPGGRTAMARPCPACMSLLHENGIHRVVYTTDTGIATERVGEALTRVTYPRPKWNVAVA